MNLWILNHYAGSPESSSTRHFDLSRELVGKGHSVTIFASGYNHFKLTEERLRPGEKWKMESYDGVRFLWIRTFPYKGNGWRRVVNMLSYAWRVIWIGRGLSDRPNIIIGSCVHPFAVASAYILSKMKKSGFFFEVRDLWPQTLIDMGALREESLVARGLRMMEKFLYERADKIITLLPYAGHYITGLGIRGDKIVFIPNGANPGKYTDIRKYDGEVSDPFKIMYLGSHGRANALDVILDAAKIVQDRGTNNFRFIFVGGGPEKESLINYAENCGLKNVEFLDSVPKNEIYKIMGVADAFVVALADLPLYGYGISLNKIFDYLASGRPVLFSGNSANDPIKEAGAGISVPAGDPTALAEAVEELYRLTPEERVRMGENGIRFLKENHDIRMLADKLDQALSR